MAIRREIMNEGYPPGVNVSEHVIATFEDALQYGGNAPAVLAGSLVRYPEFSTDLGTHILTTYINSQLHLDRYLDRLVTDSGENASFEDSKIVFDTVARNDVLAFGTNMRKAKATSDFVMQADQLSSAYYSASTGVNNIFIERPEMRTYLIWLSEKGNGGVASKVEEWAKSDDAALLFEFLFADPKIPRDPTQPPVYPAGQYLSFILSFIQREHLQNILARGSNDDKESAKSALHVAVQLKEQRKKMHSTILNPDSDGYDELSQKVWDRLSTSSERTNYLVSSYLAGDKSIKEFYQLVCAKLREGEDDELYEALKEAVASGIMFADTESKEVFIEDIEAVVSVEEAGEGEAISAHDKLVNQIVSFTSQKAFDLDVDSIDWAGITKPQTARLELSKNSPHTYSYTLFYENEYGDELSFTVSVDSKTLKSSWSLIDSPQDSPDVMKQLILAGEKIVGQSVEIARAIHQSKQKNVAPVVGQQRNNFRVDRGAHSGSKVYHQAAPRVFDVAVRPFEEAVPQEIHMPSEEEFKKMTAGFSSVDREYARAGIERFNRHKKGRLKMVSVGKEDPVYELRTRRQSGGGGIRILVHELDTPAGKRDYKVAIVKIRNQMFDKNRKWFE